MHTHIYTHLYAHIQTQITHSYIYSYIPIYTRIYLYICIHMQTEIYTHIHHIHLYAHITLTLSFSLPVLPAQNSWKGCGQINHSTAICSFHSSWASITIGYRWQKSKICQALPTPPANNQHNMDLDPCRLLSAIIAYDNFDVTKLETQQELSAQHLLHMYI